jgi:feruloyl esterase
MNLIYSAILAAVAVSQASAAPCESLTSLNLKDTTITLAQLVPAGRFTPPDTFRLPGPLFKQLPAFCRVAATLKPSQDSDIKIEVWMPASGWNGKFEGTGNGGWAGSIIYSNLGTAIQRGYATANTDTGHSGNSASFALGHPEKLVDFGYRAVHEMTVQAKTIIAAYYGNGPKRSYWNGCSSGGREGLKEAQRFPRDYDGIVAGAAANNWTHLMAGESWVGLATRRATLEDPASYIPPEKYAVIHKAVLDACDSLDGVKDGVLEDPTRCHFDPKVLQCIGADTPACLTAPQVAAVRKIYAPVTNPRTGQEIYPGLQPGGELGWTPFAAGPRTFAIPDDYFKHVVFKNPAWDFRTLNFDTDVALADKLDDGTINATDPNLKELLAHGGKLLLYHGWSDPFIAPENTVNYYKSVVKAIGGVTKLENSVRLFMVPGMEHCHGGDGPCVFDMMSAMEQWVEKGKAPDQIIASHGSPGKIDRTRPLCPYPKVARYKGTGSTDDAANFVCALP